VFNHEARGKRKRRKEGAALLEKIQVTQIFVGKRGGVLTRVNTEDKEVKTTDGQKGSNLSKRVNVSRKIGRIGGAFFKGVPGTVERGCSRV